MRARLPDEIRETLLGCREYFMLSGLFSAGINLLYLIPSLYMLQLYDRVISSQSIETLIFMSIAAMVALAVLAALDDVRARVLVRMGIRLDNRLSERVLGALVQNRVQPGSRRYSEGLRDLDTVRQLVTSNGLHAALDAPWFPLYLMIIAVVHPGLGLLALFGAVLLVALTIITEITTKRTLSLAGNAAMQTYATTDSALRNSEVILAMGMQAGVSHRLMRQRGVMLAFQALASDKAAHLTSISKVLRIFLQSAMLGLGAYYVILNEITPGMMIVGSILMGRALAPIEILVASWRQIVGGRDAYMRVRGLLREHPARPPSMPLPQPAGAINVERLIFQAPNTARPILKGLNINIPAGQSVGIVGPSGAGKTCLTRLLLGIWKPSAGVVRLDGADVATWDRADLGRHIGYLPQDIELFPGSVRDNIARFGDGAPEEIIRAAQRAGVHEMILQLPNGYETNIGDAGAILSGGQRQRVGLARALFGQPRLLILDEPNSNLDSDGEQALIRALGEFKQAGSTVIVVAHRPSVLSTMDSVIVLRDGLVEMVGPRAEILARLQPTVVRPTAFMRGGGGEPPGGVGKGE
ncbi:MAG: type I secretion system permease/ATPase [Alphaproteobacteria bacterium]|nr:type I secretion system permease/ATPase [Alphaproteobacteria bacterium]